MAEPAPARHLLLYGSLRRGEPGHRQLGLAGALRFVRLVRLPGRMYDFRDFPGVVMTAPDERFTAELHLVLDASLIRRLDAFERFDPRRPRASLYVREVVNAAGVRAYIYLYNRDPGAAAVIASGDWQAHRRAQASNSRPMPV